MVERLHIREDVFLAELDASGKSVGDPVRGASGELQGQLLFGLILFELPLLLEIGIEGQDEPVQVLAEDELLLQLELVEAGRDLSVEEESHRVGGRIENLVLPFR